MRIFKQVSWQMFVKICFIRGSVVWKSAEICQKKWSSLMGQDWEPVQINILLSRQDYICRSGMSSCKRKNENFEARGELEWQIMLGGQWLYRHMLPYV